MLGLQLDFNRVLDLAAGGAVGRPHIAQAMIERGFVNSTAEAFDRYLASGRPAYVPRFRVTPVEATRLITETGGIAVLAHPLAIGAAAKMGQIDLPVVLPELKAAGLAGLETYYTGYSAENIKTLLGYCDQFDLIPTGGSDFHGGGVLTISDLGTLPVPPEVVERLRDANRKNTGG
jgi:predicted metal-dependent phosphoesterase TrpH